MSCDPQDLADAAACFACLGEAQLDAVIVYLLCEMAP